MANVLASPAPAAPIGLPVPQPAMSTGARMMFNRTVIICRIIVGLTMPVPRSVANIATMSELQPEARRTPIR